MRDNLSEKVPLPAEFRSKWLEALRSGDFDQTESYLFIDGQIDDVDRQTGYCCLGVACSILGVPPNAMREVQMPNEIDREYRDTLPSQLTMRAYVSLGVNRDIGYSEFLDKVTHLNDNGFTFFEIAEWIEENTTDE